MQAWTFTLQPMTETYAREVAVWQYTGDLGRYNVTREDVDEEIKTMLNPEFAYFVAFDDEQRISGYCCFGKDAQVPGGDYSVEAVDIGLALRPDLLGQGLGTALLKAAIARIDGLGNGVPLRATIATGNTRSCRLFEKAGFQQRQVFQATDTGDEEFVVVVRQSHARHEPVTETSASEVDQETETRQ